MPTYLQHIYPVFGDVVFPRVSQNLPDEPFGEKGENFSLLTEHFSTHEAYVYSHDDNSKTNLYYQTFRQQSAFVSE